MGAEGSSSSWARPLKFFQVSLISSIEGLLRKVTNTAAVDYGVITADIGTVSYWGIFDSQSGGNLLWFGSFARGKNVLNGDAITVKAGAITCNLS